MERQVFHLPMVAQPHLTPFFHLLVAVQVERKPLTVLPVRQAAVAAAAQAALQAVQGVVEQHTMAAAATFLLLAAAVGGRLLAEAEQGLLLAVTAGRERHGKDKAPSLAVVVVGHLLP